MTVKARACLGHTGRFRSVHKIAPTRDTCGLTRTRRSHASALAEAARDCLVTAAHSLAGTIEQSLSVIAIAAAGNSASREVSFAFNVPADERELDSFTPKRIAYARDATLRALGDVEDCCREAPRMLPAARTTSGPSRCWLPEPAAPTVRSNGFWSGLFAILLGLLIADALLDGD